MSKDLDRRLAALEGAPGNHNDKWRTYYAQLHLVYGEPGEEFVFDEHMTDAQHRALFDAALERVYGKE